MHTGDQDSMAGNMLSLYIYILLLASTNAPTIEKLSIFVFKALNTRKLSLSLSLGPREVKLPECSLLL